MSNRVVVRRPGLYPPGALDSELDRRARATRKAAGSYAAKQREVQLQMGGFTDYWFVDYRGGAPPPPERK